ncbi:hypothetical protein L596_008272 [Steinernema carpocapsae]|uniref:Uncharacterized protein n=1 Tax=Steinernema carpocapsae TaxID=34508 RepID=A0A4U5PD21_STECR|nr:hypothetical protein L596_008272 [Steinernema carpocapsae]
MFLRIAVLAFVVFCAVDVKAYYVDKWVIINDGTHVSHDIKSRFANFDGYEGYPAYIQRNGAEAFGHAYWNQSDVLCVDFVDSQGHVVTDYRNFRVLDQSGGEFRLVSFNSIYNENNLVQFYHKRAALIHSPNGAFYGWVDLDRNEAHGVDKNGRAFKYVGTAAIDRYCDFIELWH